MLSYNVGLGSVYVLGLTGCVKSSIMALHSVNAMSMDHFKIKKKTIEICKKKEVVFKIQYRKIVFPRKWKNM